MDLIFDLRGLYFSLHYRTLTFSNPNNDGESYRFLLTFLYFMYAVICLQDPKFCLFYISELNVNLASKQCLNTED